MIFNIVNLVNNGLVRANGGAGDAATSTDLVTPGGGGGGAAGGTIMLNVALPITGSGTFQVLGGAGGAGINGGTAGSPGANGNIIALRLI